MNHPKKKKNSERFKQEFGLDTNEFGLNGQDYGVAHFKKATPKSRGHQPTTMVATKEVLDSFYDDVATLWCGGGIPVLDEVPSAITFLRDYVSKSRPCIIRNALMREDEQNPLRLTLDDLVEMDPNLEIVVDSSPDGHADCVRTVVDHSTGDTLRLFVTPEQRTMTIHEFRSQLREGRKKSRQGRGTNDNGDAEEIKYDSTDGKQIFGLKNSKKQKQQTFEDFVYQGCTPTNADNTAPFEFDMGCNALGDMQEIIMPLMGLMDDKSDPNKSNHPPEPPPPPPPPESVLYYSRQNDCFRNELQSIFEATRKQIPDSFRFAEEAFGTGKPEAVNLWIGDERATSSMHKDPYENLFYVASGEKIFTLCPPADAPFLYEQDFLSGSFDSQLSNKRAMRMTKKQPPKREWTVKTGFEDVEDEDSDDDDDDDIRLNQHPSGPDVHPVLPEKANVEEHRPAYVRWIEADVSALTDPYYKQMQMQQFPLLKYTHPIHEVRVQAGELLYLPALWFHRVTQSQETVGLNYWYNMNFDSPHWCYFQLVSQLKCRGLGLPANEERILDGKRDESRGEKYP